MRPICPHCLLALTLLLVCTGSASASAQTLAFRQGVDGYSGVHDTYLRNNYGALGWDDAYMRINSGDEMYSTQNGVLRFGEIVGPAVGQIPPLAQIVSATLRLRTDNDPGDEIRLHRMKLGWDETTFSDDAAGASPFNDDDWVQADGKEAEISASASFVPAIPNTAYFLDVTADVEAWVGGVPNFGWVLLGTTEDEVRIQSSDAVDEGSRPLLTVTFSPPIVVSGSPDVTLDLGVSGPVAADETAVADDQLGGLAFEDLGPLPVSSEVIALAHAANGDRLFALESTALLSGDVLVRPGDVVRYDGAAYTLEFEAAGVGLPSRVATDALSRSGSSLLLSFDKHVDLGAGLVVADEDLVEWNGSSFALVFDGSAEGVASALDVDGAHDVGDGRLFLSFDTGGEIAGLLFEDEDVLRFEAGSWSLEYDASAVDPRWARADLDALYLPEPARLGLPGLGAVMVFGLARRRRPGRNKEC